MAARRRRTTRKKTTARRRPARRASTRRAPARRRRRKNPSFDTKGTLMACAGGAAIGAAAYAMQGTDAIKDPKYKAAAILAGGALLGLAASSYSKPAGAGIAGGGVAIGALQLLNIYMASSEEMGAIPPYAQRRFGYQQPHQLHAVRADLGAVQADLSAVQADLI